MKNKPFYDVEHANRYLSASVIRVKDAPVMVQGVRGEGLRRAVILYNALHLADDEVKEVPLTSPTVDMDPVPLGFVTYSRFGNPSRMCVVSRNPVRDWKVGLARGNIRIEGHPTYGGETPERADMMRSRALADTIMGVFPSMRQAIKQVQAGGAVGVAFSRRFGLGGNSRLYYYALPAAVGRIYDNNTVVLDKDYEYLSQVLQEDMR